MTPKATHGGARAGAGRPAKPKQPTGPAGDMSPLDWLLAVMRDPTATAARRMRAAIAALPYCHVRPVPGKKVQAQEAAQVLTLTGRFRPTPPPTGRH